MPGTHNNEKRLCASCYDVWVDKGMPTKSDGKPTIKLEYAIRSLPGHCNTMNKPQNPTSRKIKIKHPTGNIQVEEMTENTYFYYKDPKTGKKRVKVQSHFAWNLCQAFKSTAQSKKATKFQSKQKIKSKQNIESTQNIESKQNIKSETQSEITTR
eukprot:100364_1